MRNISDLPISGSENEYISLRDEIIERVTVMNNQASSAFGVILTVWAAGFTCLGIMAACWTQMSYPYMRWLSICPVGAFFISLLIILPMAIKSGENVRQIISIGVFIKIFYEYIPSIKNQGCNNIGWETANAIVNRGITQKAKNKRFFNWFDGKINDRINSEYTLLGIASLFFMFIAILINREIVRNSERIWIYYTAYSICLFFSIFYIGIISFQSNGKRNAKMANQSYTKEFLLLAIEKSILTEEEVKQAWLDLNPQNEVNRIRLDTLFK